MRFRFSAPNLAGGLKLIEEIPNYPICHLEGRNGTGKSVALRLLELLSGEQPYEASPAAWKSLRQALGECTVTVEDIQGGPLQVHLTPSGWPEEPERLGARLGAATFGGVPIDPATIGNILRVIRIAGDETLEVTIQRRVSADAAAIERLRGRFEASRSGVEHRLDELDAMIAVADPAQLQQDRAKWRQLTASVSAAEAELRARQQEVALLNRALLAKRRLSAFNDDIPKLHAELDQVIDQMSALEATLKDREKRQSQLLTSLSRGSQLQTQIDTVRKSRDRRLGRVQNLEREIQRQAAALKIQPDAAAVDAAIQAGVSESAEIQRMMDSTGHHAEVRSFEDRLLQDLDAHPALDTEVVATFETGLDISGRELRRAVETRRVALSDSDDPVTAELETRHHTTLARLFSLQEVRSQLGAFDRASERLREDEATLTALVARAEATNELRLEYNTVTADTQQATAQLRDMFAQQARLNVKLAELEAGKTESEVAEDLQLTLAELEASDSEHLDERLQSAAVAAEDARVRILQQRGQVADVQRSIVAREADSKRVSQQLASQPWLPNRIRGSLLGRDEDPAAALVNVAAAVHSSRDALYAVRDRFDQVVQASRTLSADLSTRGRARNEVPLVAELARALGARLRSDLDQEEIRQALFDGGELAEVNLDRLEATWKIGNEERTRPLEAFSSGEQVFAYTRARIERVEDVQGPLKVIALDEFGAFLARDRLERLARYLREAVLGRIAEQVIIVVPLAANYTEQADETVGDLHERFVRRADQIGRRGYFAEDASERELV